MSPGEFQHWIPFVLKGTLVLIALYIASVIWDLLKGNSRSRGEIVLDVVIFFVLIVWFREEARPYAVAGFSFIARHRLLDLPVNPLTLLACFVLLDFLYYLSHRLEHAVPFLWAHHSVHHSSQDFTFGTGFRVSPIAYVYTVAYLAVPMWIGFDPYVVIAMRIAIDQYMVVVHTNRLEFWNRLGYVLNTPSNHRPHHSYGGVYSACNYGGALIIWDRLFGTFVPERAEREIPPKFHPVSFSLKKLYVDPYLELLPSRERVSGEGRGR